MGFNTIFRVEYYKNFTSGKNQGKTKKALATFETIEEASLFYAQLMKYTTAPLKSLDKSGNYLVSHMSVCRE